ncbi:MAG TPA: P-loop NTPase [Solirubrobacteraceae bacterium]|jgi:CO dehydrogenase maturation factor|nr:P-loop NTPase [Solirubrobacteraceae bacterium]
MKILVAGKGGVGKTTVSATLARAFARAGRSVIALDADSNPMLGVSLGVGPEESDVILDVYAGLATGETEHQRSTEGFVERFGLDAPDGVRLVIASRVDTPNPGCRCCGVSPHSLLGELEQDERIVICDLEAGLGTLMRLEHGQADVLVVVAQPTAKSIEVARQVLALAAKLEVRVIVVANRVRDGADLEAITAVLGDEHELVVVPDEPVIGEADRDGRAAMDVDPDAPGVRALVDLADRITGIAATA